MKQCVDCGKQFSDELNACPSCGCPAEECPQVVVMSKPDTSSKAANDNPVKPMQQATAPQPTMPYAPQQVQSQAVVPQPGFPNVIDYSKRRLFYLIAGGIALLGALVVIASDTMVGVASLMYGMFFALLSAGITLIGMGISIKQ